MPTPLKIIFSASGAFGSPTLRALISNGHHIIKVFTQPNRPAGRGKKLTPTPIAALAAELNLPLQPTANINAEPLPEADVMIVIAFGQKIAENVVNHPRFGSINLHASILPKYRGAAPINWAIINGEKFSGNSIIRLANKMDAGAVLATSQLQIGDSETTGELHDRLADDGAPLVLKVLEQLAIHTATEIEQDHTMATIAPKLSRETAVIDWNQSSEKIARRINGLSPWPGCRVRLVDEANTEIAKLTLLKSKSELKGTYPFSSIGTVLADGSIGSSEGSVELLLVQPEGKRPMPLGDYTRGNRWTPGLRVESIH